MSIQYTYTICVYSIHILHVYLYKHAVGASAHLNCAIRKFASVHPRKNSLQYIWSFFGYSLRFHDVKTATMKLQKPILFVHVAPLRIHILYVYLYIHVYIYWVSQPLGLTGISRSTRQFFFMAGNRKRAHTYCMHKHVNMYLQVYTHIYAYVCMAYTSIYTHICMCVCMYICIWYVFLTVYVCVYVYVYASIYTMRISAWFHCTQACTHVCFVS
jgi:hypothetical protein